jgi:hypothetical protein
MSSVVGSSELSIKRRRLQLVGIAGALGAGKDTAGYHLVECKGFARMSFASALKDAVAAIFGWDRDMLEGDTEMSRRWREVADPYWTERLAGKGIFRNDRAVTPRLVLQRVGTELFRNQMHEDIWTLAVEQRLNNAIDRIIAGEPGDDDGGILRVVITDVRFPNELEMIRRMGGMLVYIRRNRPGKMATQQQPASFADYPRKIIAALFGSLFSSPAVHASESALDGHMHLFDAVIDNDGSIPDLYHKLDAIIR